MDRLSDSYLLEGFVNGEPERVEVFTKHFYPKVRSLVYKLVRNDDVSKDITQDVFMIVFEKHKSFRKEAKLLTWILRIAYNQSLKFLTKNGQFFYSLDDTHYSITDETEAWQLLEEKLDVLEEAMSELTASDQLFLELYYTNGLSIREISGIVEKSETAVKTGLSRVRKRLSEIIGTKYGEN